MILNNGEVTFEEGDLIKKKNGSIARIYSIGVSLFSNWSNINLDDGTFCFKDDIIEYFDEEKKEWKKLK